jgi:SAM-dependent methyltransferase
MAAMAETARYDDVADFYIQGVTDDLSDRVTSTLLDFLSPGAGQSILDIACGHGRVTRGLARHGAQVVAVDLSVALLDRAAAVEDTAPLGIRYVQANVADPELLPGEIFDAAVSSFGLSDIDNLDGMVANVHRLLRPGGTFAFSILHPCFAGGENVSGAWPSSGRYYDEGWWQADGSRSVLRQQVGANHRTLSTYLNTFRRHGLRLEEIAEPEPATDWASTRPDAARFPVFLVAKLSNGHPSEDHPG